MVMAMVQLTSRVWHTLPVEAGDRPALGLAVGENAGLLIDGGNSPAHVEEVLQMARRVSDVPLKALCLTHWHCKYRPSGDRLRGDQGKAGLDAGAVLDG